MLSSVFLSVSFLSVVHFSCTQPQLNVFYSDNQLPKNIAHIINRFLITITDEIDFIIASNSESQKILQLDMLNGLLPHLELRTTVALRGFWEQSHSMFILADSHTSFRKILLSTDNNQYELTGYFLVYITDEISHGDLINIFKDCLEHQIIEIGVILPIQILRNDLVLYTYFPFRKGSCYNHNPIPICVYNEGIFLSLEGEKCTFYPKKTFNFHGCELIVSTYEMAPYLTFNRGSEGIVSVSGLEGEVLTTLAKKLNFETIYLVPNLTQSIDRVKLFTSGPANISIGRLRATTIRRRNVSSSTAYYKSDLVMIIRLGRPLYSLERLFSPASVPVWFSFAIILASAYTVVIVVYTKLPAAREFIFGAGNRDPTYWLWVTTLGGPVEYKPRRNFARYMLMNWIMLTFFLRSGYQSFFYQSIRMNWQTYTANNMGEVLTNGYEIVATTDTLRSLSDISQLKGRVGVFNGSEMEALQNLSSSHRKLVVIGPKEVFRYYKWVMNQSNLTLIKEPVLEQMVCMHFRTNSYLKKPFDRNLHLLGVSGLLAHWKTVHVPQPERFKGLTLVPQKLRLSDVVGPFQVYSFAIMNSFIAFTIEFLSLKFFDNYPLLPID